jgi:hypothetical protein
MQTVAIVRELVGWCAVVNFGLLYVWFLLLALAHDWLYKLHHRWFSISREQFDAIHYAGMAMFKIGIILLNLTPYIALLIVS